MDASLLKYRPSQIAAASLVLAAKNSERSNPWTDELTVSTGIAWETLKTIVEDVKSFVVEVNPKFLTTLKYKFSKPEYMEVACLSLALKL